MFETQSRLHFRWSLIPPLEETEKSVRRRSTDSFSKQRLIIDPTQKVDSVTFYMRSKTIILDPLVRSN